MKSHSSQGSILIVFHLVLLKKPISREVKMMRSGWWVKEKKKKKQMALVLIIVTMILQFQMKGCVGCVETERMGLLQLKSYLSLLRSPEDESVHVHQNVSMIKLTGESLASFI
uniref:Uncharacterized protein n=1 Tax=Noccaea caerulescens TaxID=107243 RepID=A0A1J3J8E8_NOCCA